MNVESVELGKAAAESFKKYWKKSEAMLKEQNIKTDPTLIFSLSLVYAAGFFTGYDYCKDKTKEIAELN